MKIYNNVSPYFDGTGTATPSDLLEIDPLGLSRIKDNIIHLSQKLISDCGNLKNALYNDVQYVKDVNYSEKRTVSNGKQIFWNEINLPQMKYGYCIFTIDKKEIGGDDVIRIIGSSICDECPSSALVLAVVVQKTLNCNEGQRQVKKHYSALRYAKYITVTETTKYFLSAGYIYSYGNKGNYVMISNSSVAQHVNKNKSTKGELKANTIEMMCSKEITMGIVNVCTIISTMRGFIAPIFDVSYHMRR